jgi:hypothetical protein
VKLRVSPMPVSGPIPMVFAVSVTPNEAEMNTAQI